MRGRYRITVTHEPGCAWSLEKAERLALTTPEKEERLRDAAKEGKLDEAKEVLKEGVNPDAAESGFCYYDDDGVSGRGGGVWG